LLVIKKFWDRQMTEAVGIAMREDLKCHGPMQTFHKKLLLNYVVSMPRDRQ
jgi:hypothetical protein